MRAKVTVIFDDPEVARNWFVTDFSWPDGASVVSLRVIDDDEVS